MLQEIQIDMIEQFIIQLYKDSGYFLSMFTYKDKLYGQFDKWTWLIWGCDRWGLLQ